MQTFSCKTKIIVGPGARLSLKERGAKKVFLVTDRFFSENGTAEALAREISTEYRIFDDVRPDPTAELAAEGTAQLLEFGPDLVVALGGGSAMDCAKAMVYFSGLSVPLAAIPTTSGSGAEVTDFAILTHEGVKHPLVHERLRPDVAILDSDLLDSMPKSLIADAGFDILTHALEAAAAINGTGFSDALAARAFRTAYAKLPASFGGDKSCRLEIHVASCMAGLAFSQSGLGLCHALSHSLGGRFHVAHGRLNAILLPLVVGLNAQAAGEKYAALARETGFSGSAETLAVRNLRSGLIRLRRELKLPATLREAGIDPRDLGRCLDAVVQAALRDPCCKTNPVEPTAPMVEELLKEAAGGSFH